MTTEHRENRSLRTTGTYYTTTSWHDGGYETYPVARYERRGVCGCLTESSDGVLNSSETARFRTPSISSRSHIRNIFDTIPCIFSLPFPPEKRSSHKRPRW